ncbi:MAG: BREX system ATP-binding protein BrxD [Myxococcaceae bacterium]|nr:MAG: BREX system ATP-binding protein BrxD [Myxococcaceae bacterium]
MTNGPTSNPNLVRRQEIVAALRNGAVPRRGIELYGVGLDRFAPAIHEELDRAATGTGVFKAVRGDYGAGKTFFARWVQGEAMKAGFACADVQISEVETPLYRLETIYRRAMESLRTKEWSDGSFRLLLDRWFYALEEEVSARPGSEDQSPEALAQAVGELLERRLAEVSATQPPFATALRSMYRARMAQDHAAEEGLVAWLMAKSNVSADVKRRAGIQGQIDNDVASGFFRGLLCVLRQTERRGLCLVLDEVETVQRMRSDMREKSLNALRQLIDEVSAGRYPGLYLLITGTPAFFEGRQGVKSLPPLEQRLHVDFGPDAQFDSSRAIQIRLPGFTIERLLSVGKRVRDLYPTQVPERIQHRVSDAFIEALAGKVAGQLGAQVGIAPRIFLKKLVGEVLDKVEEHEAFDPQVHYQLSLTASELSSEERGAAGLALSPDEVALTLPEDPA